LKEERHWRMETANGPVLIELIPLIPSGGDQSAIGVLQLSTTLRNGDALLESLRNQLLIGSVLAFIATVIITLPLVRGVLTPLRRMAAASRAITSGDLGRRVSVPEGGDALADLAIAFNDMVGKLDGALATQRRFIADASHELRTPLTALGNGVEMLQMGVDRRDPEARAKLLRLMSGEIARMGRLVDDLLTLSALDRDPLRAIAHTPVDLTALIAQVVDETRLLAPDLRVELALEGSQPLSIRGDSDRIRQALLNLCANARAHTPQGGSITIALAQGDDEAVVNVTDTGSGIPAEALDRVWDRFFRVDPSRERRGGGVGLGLAIVRAIVEAHGGTVAITSTVGVGTDVMMTFPTVSATAPRASSGEEPNVLAAPRHREALHTSARNDG
jgi:signal transduction histidine kinase